MPSLSTKVVIPLLSSGENAPEVLLRVGGALAVPSPANTFSACETNKSASLSIPRRAAQASAPQRSSGISRDMPVPMAGSAQAALFPGWEGGMDPILTPWWSPWGSHPCGAWHRAFLVVSTGEQKHSPRHCGDAAQLLGSTPWLYNKPRQVIHSLRTSAYSEL